MILHKKGIQSDLTLSLLVELPKISSLPTYMVFQIFTYMSVISIDFSYFYKFLLEFAMILHEKSIQSGLTLRPLALNFQKLHGESSLYILFPDV